MFKSSPPCCSVLQKVVRGNIGEAPPCASVTTRARTDSELMPNFGKSNARDVSRSLVQLRRSLPQRQRARHAGNLADGVAGAQGLDVSGGGGLSASGRRVTSPGKL